MRRLKDDREVDSLIATLNNDDSKSLVVAIDALVNLGSRRSVKPLMRLIHHRNTEVRRSVARALGSLGGSRAIQPLVELMGDKHKDIFEAAQASLVEMGKPTIKPLTVKLYDGNEQVRRRSGEVLARLAVDAADKSLLDALRYQDRQVRVSAAQSMHVSYSDAVAEGLLATLQDPSFRVREAAATSLGSMCCEALVIDRDIPIKALFALLEKEREPARKAAAEALLKILNKYPEGHPEIIQGFQRALENSNLRVRYAVVSAIYHYLDSTRFDFTGWISLAKLITLIIKKPDPEPLIQAASLRVLKLVDNKFGRAPRRGRVCLFDDMGSEAHSALVECCAKAKAFLADAAEAVSRRYADFAFLTDEPNSARIPDNYALLAGQWYQLEVAVRAITTGISPEEGTQRPIREPTQQRDVTIMVTAEGDAFEIPEPVQTLTLPPSGDSTKNAHFRVRPLYKSANRDNLAKIRLRLYYEFNLLEVALIKAEVVGKFDDPTRSQLGLGRPISFKQERLEQDYLDLDHVQPRAMHIDITRQGDHFQFNFTFYNAIDEKIVFTAPARLAPTDLEDDLLNIRKIWYDIALSKSFSEHLVGDKDEFVTYMGKLASAGRGLWVKLFKRERTSALFQVGEWLESHPVEPGGIVQVSTGSDAVSFVFPWSLLYDQRLPRKAYELPDPQGFWGVRYCIEQNVPNRSRGSDEPVRVDEHLNMAFMLWEQFRNAGQQKAFFESLQTRSAGKLAVSRPPLTDADECFGLLAECDSDLLYFYTHGYTRHRQADIGVGPNLDLFIRRYERLEPGSSLRETYRLLYESVKQKQFEPDRSWIELTTGKIYLNELYENIEFLNSRPFVFLNMCESAQVTPSLSDSFVHFFLDRGARGVIGTECPMTIEFAHPFAEKFLTGMLEGQPVGKVLLAARRHFLELSNPLGLAYTLFGSATVRIEPPVL